MHFNDWVSEDVVCHAGFNYHQQTWGIQRGEKCYPVYLGQFGAARLNIVVIEGIRYCRDGYERREWFFGTFKGNSPGQCRTSEEYRFVSDKIEGILSRKKRVSGNQLEGLINKALERYFEELAV